jgi:hypothetical protein
LELAFDSKSLRTLCESEAIATRQLGPEVAEAVKHRLADLRAATSVKDLVAGRLHKLDGTDSRYMVVDLCNDYQMIFCANHPKNPMTKSGELDWAKICRIKILRIERVHG